VQTHRSAHIIWFWSDRFNVLAQGGGEIVPLIRKSDFRSSPHRCLYNCDKSQLPEHRSASIIMRQRRPSAMSPPLTVSEGDGFIRIVKLSPWHYGRGERWPRPVARF
jgi:hypothetical protein